MLNPYVKRVMALCLVCVFILPLVACQAAVDDNVSLTPTPEVTAEASESPVVSETPDALETETPDETAYGSLPPETAGTSTSPSPANVSPSPSSQPAASPSVEPSPSQQSSTESIGSFSTSDIDGKSYSNAIFGNATITILNLWSTTCAPCIAELPVIQRVSNEYASRGVKVYGILGDSEDPGAIETVRGILADKGVTYPTLRNNTSVNNAIFKKFKIAFYPYTFFVDSNGNILETASKSMPNYSDWTNILDRLLP